jgi:hypothetical protein
MAKKKRFLPLLESYMRRYERGGFLVGDIFKFNDNFNTNDDYKQLGQNVKDLIDQMIESGLHIRVVGIKDTSPQRYPGGDGGSLLPVLDLALDTGGGRFSHYVSVPCQLGEPIAHTPNLPPIPDALRRKDKVNIKPEELEQDEENLTNKTDKGDGELSQTERTLPVDNTQIPSNGVAKSTVGQYLKELSK